MKTKDGIGERILLARRIAGLTQRALAARAGVSAMAISKYERNQDMPGSAVLLRLTQALGVRVEFFLRPARVRDIAPSFCQRALLPPEKAAAVVARVQEWLERYLETEEIVAEEAPEAVVRFEFPSGFPLPIGPHGDGSRLRAPSERTLESLLRPCGEAAYSLRDAWELGSDPIDNLTELLEAKGVKVGVVDDPVGFDAWAFWVEADRRIPVIVLRAGLPGDHARFSLAHELGHLLLAFPEGWATDLVEQGASRFASELLLPAEAVRSELGAHRCTISLYELHLLKHKYGVSMQTWLSRAKTLGILTEEDAERLLSPFRQADWKGKEPGDEFPSEQPTRLERMVMHALAEGWISERRASELLGRPFRQFTQEVADKHGGLPVSVCV